MYELTRHQSSNFVNLLNSGVSDEWSAGPSVALILTGCDPFHRLKILVAGINFDVKYEHKFVYSISNIET